MQLEGDQEYAYTNIMKWIKSNPKGFLTLGGYAGSGKTTLVAEIMTALYGFCKPHVMAITGKAVNVLKSKGLHGAATIHSTIYDPRDEGGKVVFDIKDIDEVEADVFIVDEASMVNEDIHRDIQSFGLPILYVGDHGQLPPVGTKFNLMENPDYRLEKIHRQAKGNPILCVAENIRNGAYADFENSKYQNTEKIDRWTDCLNRLSWYDITICCTNKTRVQINQEIRKRKWYNLQDLSVPYPGDVVMCYRNNRSFGVFNGQSFVIEDVRSLGSDDRILLKLKGDCGKVTVPSRLKGFNSKQPDAAVVGKDYVPFDYGYCSTCHKAQGSEYGKVLIVYEPYYFRPRFGENPDLEFSKRWLYTAVTRAKEFVTITRKL